MTYRTEPRQETGRPEDGGAAAKPICRRLLSIDQAAEVAERPVHEICHWIRTRKLEVYHLGGGRVRIDEVELAELLSSLDFKRP